MDRPSGYRDPNPGGIGRNQVLDGLGLAQTMPGLFSPNTQSIRTASGARVTIQADGSADIDREPEAQEPEFDEDGFGENLAKRVDDGALSSIANDLLEGIANDEQSRMGWVEQYTAGMDFLGIVPKQGPTQAQKGTVSTVYHPILLEAVVRFQSTTRPELLPANGPAKVRDDAPGGNAFQEDTLANHLQRDLNHYLTVVATEYYPDMDRGLFYLGYGGTLFRKGYICPLRKRPVVECVYAPDLIVSNEATDIQNALRVTHSIPMLKSQIRRMMLAGQYRDIELQLPTQEMNPVAAKIGLVEGRNPMTNRQQDVRRIVYECYCELDLTEYGHNEKGVPKDLPVPYRVVIDKESRQILELRRDWKEDDKLFRRRRHFVKYGLVPGFGFYDLGFLHLIGNQAKALTGIWRILIDAGMFSNFPGGVKAKGRTGSSEINPAPGEFVEVDMGGAQKIQDAIMPMPYKPPSPVMLEMAQAIEAECQKLGQIIEMETGEGRTNIPVGTIVSQVEQQTQILQAIHKRLHSAQQEELLMLKELFAEDPTALWRYNPDPAHKWEEAEEFMDQNLVPASDPNVPAQVARAMQGTALSGLVQADPTMYNRHNVHQYILSLLEIDPTTIEWLMVTPDEAAQAGAQPDPKAEADKAKAQASVTVAETNKAKAQVEMQKAQIDMQTGMSDDQQKVFDTKVDAQVREREIQGKLQEAHIDQQTELMKAHVEAQHKQQELQMQAQNDHMQRQHEMGLAHVQGQQAMQQQGMQQQHDAQLAAGGQAHEQQMAAREEQHEGSLQAQTQQHEAGLQQREAATAQKQQATQIQADKQTAAAKPKVNKNA